jgi:hypothetical protein
MTTMSRVPAGLRSRNPVTEIAFLTRARPAIRNTWSALCGGRSLYRYRWGLGIECRHNTPVQLAHGHTVKAESPRNPYLHFSNRRARA